jgi:hypothetical protein
MKKTKYYLIIFSIVLVHLSTLNAQNSFQFTISEHGYEPLNDFVPYNSAEHNTLPFNISVFGSTPSDKIAFGQNSDIDLYSATLSELGWIYLGFIQIGSIGEMRYKLEGDSPNRIVKLEYVNVVSIFDFSANAPSSYQYWIHENGCLELHVPPDFLLFDFQNEVSEFKLVNLQGNVVAAAYGDASNFSYIEASTNDFPVGDPSTSLVGSLPSNSRFSFCPANTTKIEESKLLPSFQIFPNPAHSFIQIQTDSKEPVFISDLSGKQLLSIHPLNSALQTVDISELANGVYIIKQGERCIKFIKQ